MKLFGVKNLPLLLAGAVFFLGAEEHKPAHAENSKIQLISTGFAEPEWPVVKSGEKWWGLFETEDGSFELAEIELAVEDKFNACADEERPYITISEKRRPLFLVRGSERFKAGPLKTVNSEELRLIPGASCPIKQFEHPYSYLYALGNVVSLSPQQDAPKPEVEDYRLYITDEKGTVTQELLRLDKAPFGDEPPFIVWIGDLDADSKPDIYLDWDPFPGSKRDLFLSSEGAPGELVHKVATLIRRSC